MEERRRHPQECLRQEEWGEIKEFVKNTTAYRNGQSDTLEQMRKENKERFEILLAQLRAVKVDLDSDVLLVNSRVTKVKDSAGKIIFWGMISLISFATMWGGLTAIVENNTRKWNVLEPEHAKLMMDVEVLKEKSCVIKGAKHEV